MKRIAEWLAAAGGAVLAFITGLPVIIWILIGVMSLDYITGIMCGLMGKSPKTETGGVSSRAGFDGLIRKGFILIVVLVATLLDTAIGNATRVFQTAAVMYYIANEGISILENTALMGVRYPSFIIKALETMREKNDSLDHESAAGVQKAAEAEQNVIDMSKYTSETGKNAGKPPDEE